MFKTVSGTSDLSSAMSQRDQGIFLITSALYLSLFLLPDNKFLDQTFSDVDMPGFLALTCLISFTAGAGLTKFTMDNLTKYENELKTPTKTIKHPNKSKHRHSFNPREAFFVFLVAVLLADKYGNLIPNIIPSFLLPDSSKHDSKHSEHRLNFFQKLVCGPKK